ncbi:MAG: hypothetical protein H8D23_06645 [Candidatus Brocadiales bacterium]|nr:hypothetical protein [Candidatus Brocadiales bacterium]
MSEYTLNDAIGMAGDGNVAEFKDAVNSLLMDKIKDSVEIQRHQVAASFMSDVEETQNEDI